MRGLVMSGGSAYGAFTDGVLTVLADNYKDYGFVSGVSVGALCAGMISQFPIGSIEEAVQRLDDIWVKELKGDKSIYKKWWGGILGIAPGLICKEALYNSYPLWSLIRHHMDDTKVAQSGRKIRIGCCALGSGEYHEATEKVPNLSDWIIASSGMLPYLMPIRLDKETPDEDLWCDGGYRCVTPFPAAIAAGCDEIDVILTGPTDTRPFDTQDNCIGTKLTTVDTGMRVVGLMSDEIFLRDVKRVQNIDFFNDLIDELGEGHPLVGGKKKVKVRLFIPRNFLPGSSLSFDHDLIMERRQHGIDVAHEIIGTDP